MTAPAAVAFCFAAERNPACQQGRCQHANHCSHWTFHDFNWQHDATAWPKAHYFFTQVLYQARGPVLEIAEYEVAVGTPART